MNSQKLVVAILDGDGNIITSQPYNEFQNGKRNLEILSYHTGRKLFDILVDDIGAIKYEENKIAFNFILESDLYNTSMRLLGKVAEAVLVRDCKKNYELNKICLEKARRKCCKRKTVEKFQAIGTGLKYTKNTYPSKYNPSDTQRDIIWINKNSGKVAMMNGSTNNEGIEAGLQIKVSTDGIRYLLKDLVSLRYEVPVVYFDICDDFDCVAEELYKLRNIGNCRKIIKIGEDFIKGSSLSNDIHYEILYYSDLIKALIEGRIKPIELIQQAEISDDKKLKSAMISTMLSQVNIQNIILA